MILKAEEEKRVCAGRPRGAKAYGRWCSPVKSLNSRSLFTMGKGDVLSEARSCLQLEKWCRFHVAFHLFTHPRALFILY